MQKIILEANATASSTGISLYDLMKNRLLYYIDLNREIERESDRLERLEDKATSPSSPSLSGMPKAPTYSGDRMADTVGKIADLRRRINKLIDERNREKDQIETLVQSLNKSDERAVIRNRYLDLEDWDEVMFVLFGGETDFNERYDEYKQKMFRWHRSAISKMAMLVS